MRDRRPWRSRQISRPGSIRQHHVEHDEIRIGAGELFFELTPVGCHRNAKPLRAEIFREQCTYLRIIIHDQNMLSPRKLSPYHPALLMPLYISGAKKRRILQRKLAAAALATFSYK